MRPAFLLSTLGYALSIHAFEFTGPDSSEKLNLTQPITIAWNATTGSVSEPKARTLDLWFFAIVKDGWQGQEIASDLSLSSGSYKWDPKDIVKGFEEDDVSVSPDAEHYFEARLTDNDGNKLATVKTEKYALEGYDFIRNGGGKGVQPGFYTAVAATLMAGVMASMI
ncbi:hypothetical protein FPOA_11744 [Fusarium poae]|uniref:Uncharacterized protein n=1 Tax=Fusarium poae TaxID=36050 RepID=A0A1B8AHJ8_FUSPO|nr:hypothetical protein FPOA_11744 [Fusarium poae]